MSKTDPMWVFENYATAAELIDELENSLAERDAEIERLWADRRTDAALLAELRSKLYALESQQAASVGGEREAFEQIHKLLELSDSYLNVNGNGRYKYHDVQHAWEFFSSYLASRAALSPAGGGVVQVPRKALADFIEYSVPGPHGCDEKWFADKKALVALVHAKPQDE